jgi:hypothetical protein
LKRSQIAIGIGISASIIGSSTALATSHAAHPLPYFVIWKPGTPLPHVPTGYHLLAWPPQQVLGHLKVGQNVPVVKVNTAHPLRGVRANPAGLVNLELVPDLRASGCAPPVFKKDLGQHPGNVMQSYSYINTTQTFTYGDDQSTDFGVGLSASGDDGTFSADGHTSVSTTDSQGFAPQKGASNNHFQTYFEIGKYTQSCFAPWGTWTNHLVMPYQWNGGTNYVHPNYIPPATHCVPEHKGDSFTKHTTTATTFKVGYTVEAFNGTAQTGYSNTASIKFVFHQRGVLCGHTGPPAHKPGFLEAGAGQ